jgi:hypothetical protein
MRKTGRRGKKVICREVMTKRSSGPKAKPADIAGFSGTYLVALTGIETRI